MKTKDMSETIYSIKSLRNDLDLRTDIPKNPGIYQWWCKEDILRKILGQDALQIDFDKCINDIEKYPGANIIKEKNVKQFDDDNFYCIYVGEATCLLKRIVKKHITGSYNCSTLKKSIAAVLIGSSDKNLIKSQMDELYINWKPLEIGQDPHKYQNDTIDSWFRPLNNDDISVTSSKYTEERHYVSSKGSKYKRSWKLTELRNKIK